MRIIKNYKNALKRNPAFMVFSLVVLLFTGCKFLPQGFFSEKQEIDPYYITGSEENKEYFLELFTLLKAEKPGSEDEFAVVREIAASFARQKDFDRLIHFLSGRIINNPSDPYNSYYLLMIAYANIQQDSKPIAALYFD